LPLGDNKVFDWQTSEINMHELFTIILKKEQAKEIVGVGMLFETLDIGVSFLFWPDCMYRSFLINLAYNSPTIKFKDIK